MRRRPLILFPLYLLPLDGTIAADTKYYPFGTRMEIPDYGQGVVEDRGGPKKGPKVRVTSEYPQ